MKRLAFMLLAFCLAPACFAQTGYPLYGSFQGSAVDSVNLLNLNTIVQLPMIQTAGRGGSGFSFLPTYNSLVWVSNGAAWQPLSTGNWITTPPLGSVTYTLTGYSHTCGKCIGDNCQGFSTQTTWSNYVYVDPAGAPHNFGGSITDTYNGCTNTDRITGGAGGLSTDNLYYLYVGPPNTDPSQDIVWSAKTGVKMNLQAQVLTDTNGNQTTRAYVNQNEYDWKDGSGRVAMRQIQNGSNVEYHYYDPNGNDQKFVLKFQNYSVMTNFGCSGLLEYNSAGTMPQWSLPYEFDLPNGQKYQFSYEATTGHSGYITGRLTTITVPTGGTYTYAFGGSNDGVSYSSGNVTNLTRAVYDGTNTATWTYVSNGVTTTVTTPKLADTVQANDTVITFNNAGQETSRKIYPNSPGTGTPLRTINTTWATNGSPATRVTILDDGSTQSEVDTTIDQYGLLDSVSEYDFGTGSHGSLLRTTSYTYNTSSNYTNLNIRDLLTSKQIKDVNGTIQYRQDIAYDGAALLSANCPPGVTQHDDTDYPCTFNYRGNPTSVTTYTSPSVPSGGINKNFTYDFFGNLLTAQVNCCQNKTWAYSSTTNYSKPDSVTSGTSSPTLTTNFTYSGYTGQVTSSTDPNNLITNITYDSLMRALQITQKIGSTQVGGTISYIYNDSQFTVTAAATIDSAKAVQQITSFDSLGRPNLTTTEDINNNVISKVSSQYDLAGRVYKASNPFTGSSGSYWTATAFDVLGRPSSITLPDNSVTSLSYTTNATTTTDPAGVQRQSILDGVGRLSTMKEPDPSNNNLLTLSTTYTYNVLDELTQISQGTLQPRTFVYDALGRLLSATTPEANTVCFGSVTGTTCNTDGYDSFDNLVKKTDARGVLTSYGYDTLNRLSSVSYNVSGATGVPATSSLSFTYGNDSSCNSSHGAGCIGQLITMTDGVGAENYTYSNLEQLTQLQKTINGTPYTTSYVYNLASQLTQITYPSGRVVQQSVDAIGRLCEIAPSTTGCGTASSPYATGFGFNTASQLTGFKYGNGLYASFGFSPDRLQLTCLDYSTTNRSSCAHDSATKFGLTYSYPASPSNNGLVSSISDSVDSGRTASYLYDSLYRLTRATTSGSSSYPAWGLSEVYDRYGNRNQQSVYSGCTGITCPTFSSTASTTTNRLPSPYTYDLGGNMTNDGSNTLVYDAENHTTSATNSSTSGAYVYDGNGLRVRKCIPNCTSPTTSTVYVFSGSKVIAEYDNGVTSPSREYVYSFGSLLAKIDSSGTKYYHQDHLSNRYVTDSSGNKVAEMGHFPYGETWYNATNDKLYFTTYERDSESGNDYAQARYNISRLGRFSSPDLIAGSAADPQSLNRYSYVRNMPDLFTDPTGMVASCNTVNNTNEDKSKSSDSDNSGMYPNEDMESPQPQNGCWNYSGGGGGFGDGSWGLDYGYAGDDSGMGVGVPIGSGISGGPIPVVAWNWGGSEGWQFGTIGFAFLSGGDSGDPGQFYGGPMDVTNLRALAIVAAVLNPDCANLFGGINNLVASLFNSTYDRYIPGQQNPYPDVVSSGTWDREVKKLQANKSIAAFTLAYTDKPGGSIFFTGRFMVGDPGFAITPTQWTQMTGFFHEQEHAANHDSNIDKSIDSNYPADHMKINEKCKLPKVEQENSSIPGDLVEP
jgi:RHS repeat-associated protein